jgi:tetratricopeptide (TPR) repeat protein
MANTNNVGDLVSRAWQQHREGKTETAIEEFQKIVGMHPKDIDANYGLGLTQKARGDNEAALKSFKNALELISESQKVYDSTRNTDPEMENVKTPEDDRFQMLSRMVNQRLTELEKGIS